jgi:hypothetical protein
VALVQQMQLLLPDHVLVQVLLKQPVLQLEQRLDMMLPMNLLQDHLLHFHCYFHCCFHCCFHFVELVVLQVFVEEEVALLPKVNTEDFRLI